MGGAFDPSNLNSFGYVQQNPVKYTDSSGAFLDTIWDVANVIYDAAAVGYYHVKGDKESRNEALVDLGLDAGAVLIPFVPAGASKVVKVVGKNADDIVDAAKGAKRVRGCSFDGATPVLTKDGLKRIDQVAVNELVLAKDVETGKTDWKPVQDRYVNRYAETVRIELESAAAGREEILSNRIHPFFVEGKGWRKAEQLVKDDKVATANDNEWSTVVSRKILKTELLAYNLNVSAFHTYFIGKSNAWVRNCERLFQKLKGIGRAEYDKLID
jgi:uncharacterized metal-binding protein